MFMSFNLKLLKTITLVCLALFLVTALAYGSSGSGQTGNQIIYVNADIKTDTAALAGYAITCNKITLAGGRFKQSQALAPATNPGELRCSFLDAKQKVLNSVNVANPLNTLYDYTAKDNRTLKPQAVKVSQASLSVRANFSSAMKYLRVETLDRNGQLVEIVCIDLNAYLTQTPKMSVAAVAAAGPTNPVTIMSNGPDSDKIVFTILGDGYTQAEQSKFITDATNLTNYLFKDPAYAPYKSSFNVYAVPVVSNASGAANDPGQLIDNYFGSTFNYGGIQRLLVPTKKDRINQVLQTYTPQYDQALIVVNSNTYGGSGGTYATTSTNSASPEILVHELGHSFAGLSDEYWAGSGYARENINMTQNTDPNTVRWKQFMGVDGVGIYQYESPGNGWYRPHQNCKMRYLGSPFCAVCTNATKTKIQSLLQLVDKCNGGTVSVSNAASPTGEDMSKAFDDATATKWLIGVSTGWIQYNFGTKKWAVDRYTITSANDFPARDPKNWTLQGSNDGTNWTTLDTRSNERFAGRFLTKTYSFSNSTAYQMYRLNITANNGDACLQIAEIELFASGTGVIFYQDANFTGAASQTLGKGTYTMGQLSAMGIPNDKMSSLKVPSGWKVIVYQDENFGGTAWTYTADTGYVGANANDKMTSCKIQ